MPVVILQAPETETAPATRPLRCPHCSSQLLQSWGQAPKHIIDLQHRSTSIHRYRCTECRRTFRHYPEGVDRSLQSLRLRKMAALAWVLGLSSRDVVDAFGKLGVDLSRMTVWREGRDLAKQLDEMHALDLVKKYALDRLYLPGISSRFGVVIVIDAGQGKRIILGTLDEFNPRLVKTWLEQLVRNIGFKVIVAGTDFLSPPAIVPNETICTLS